MLGATLVMFAVSTSYAALDMVILIQQFMSIFIGHPDLPLATRFIVANNAVIGYEIGQTYLYTINVGRYPYLVFYYRKLIGILREFSATPSLSAELGFCGRIIANLSLRLWSY